MTSIRKINSLIHLKDARRQAMLGQCEECIASYTKAFFLRCTPEDFIDIEFSSFFSYQFRVYLAGKGDLSVSLEEGDEISRLIQDTYEKMKISLSSCPFDNPHCVKRKHFSLSDASSVPSGSRKSLF